MARERITKRLPHSNSHNISVARLCGIKRFQLAPAPSAFLKSLYVSSYEFDLGAHSLASTQLEGFHVKGGFSLVLSESWRAYSTANTDCTCNVFQWTLRGAAIALELELVSASRRPRAS
jgi:hypothetical protein